MKPVKTKKKIEKPEEPKKIIQIPQSVRFDFDHASNVVSFDYFNDWVKNTVPYHGTDITISMDEVLDDDYYSDGGIIACYLTISWKEEVENPHLVSETKKYEKKLAKWKKENA